MKKQSNLNEIEISQRKKYNNSCLAIEKTHEKKKKGKPWKKMKSNIFEKAIKSKWDIDIREKT